MRSFVKTTELPTEYASANANGGILERAMNYFGGYQTKKVKEKGGLLKTFHKDLQTWSLSY